MKKTMLIFLILTLVLITRTTIFSKNCSKTKEQEVENYFGQSPPGKIPEIFAPGFISTELRDHSDLLFLPGENEVYWSVVIDRNNGGIMHTEFENGQWKKPDYASFSSSKDRDCIPTYWPAKQRMFYSSMRPLKANDPNLNYNIWYVDRIGGGWSEPTPLNLSINGPKQDSNPAIAKDGTLYFSSDRAGDEWYSYDIFKCEFINGEFSEPEPLGESINTEYGEIVTFIAPDESYLIFTSFGNPDGHPNGDIFISFKNGKGQWSKAQSMESEINYGKGAGGGYVSSDGKYFFFINENEGNGDVYWADASIIDELKQKAEIQTDVYVKGKLKIDAGYRCGRYVPEAEITNEWWFGKDKVTFITTGWDLEWMSTGWRFTLDREEERIIVTNLTNKSFIEVPFSMNSQSLLGQSYKDRLQMVRIDGKVKKLNEKRIILEKECDVYEFREWINAFDRFYDRDRTTLATEDVPFDWKLMDDLFMWIRSFFNLRKSYISELGKFKGFILEESAIFYQLGGQQIRWSLKVSEISQKKAPTNIYGAPDGAFNKKDKFAYVDLVYMRRIVYPRPIF